MIMKGEIFLRREGNEFCMEHGKSDSVCHLRKVSGSELPDMLTTWNRYKNIVP